MDQESEGTPSGATTPNSGEQRLPPGSSIPQERNDGRAEDDAPSDQQPDWHSLAEGTEDDTPPPDDEEGEQPPDQDQPPAQKPGEGQPPQKPAAQKPPKEGEQPPARKPGEQPPGEQPDDQTPQPGEEGEQPPAQETPEQKQQREAREQEERQKFEQQLEEYYKIPDDLAARLATEPEVVLPKLATKVHQAVLTGLQQYVAQAVPQMLQQYQNVQQANQKAMDSFYSRWPALRKYEKQVLQMGRMYRQMNPKAKPEEAIERVGATVCAALGIDPNSMARGNGSQPTGGKPAVRRPVAPARPSGVGGSQAGSEPPPDNPWVQEADEMLEDDRQ